MMRVRTSSKMKNSFSLNYIRRKKHKVLLKSYRKLCKDKQRGFWEKESMKLSINQSNTNLWKEWKHLGENLKEQEMLNIDPKQWQTYFTNRKRKNDTLKWFEDDSITEDFNRELNNPFTIKKWRENINKVKNNKAEYGGIANEKFKCSPHYLLEIVLSFFNLCWNIELSSNVWCKGIIIKCMM